MGWPIKIDKACVKCGKPLLQVSPKRMYCEECNRKIDRHPKKKEEPKKLTLREIMREADKEGLQYASYCKKHGLY